MYSNPAQNPTFRGPSIGNAITRGNAIIQIGNHSPEELSRVSFVLPPPPPLLRQSATLPASHAGLPPSRATCVHAQSASALPRRRNRDIPDAPNRSGGCAELRPADRDSAHRQCRDIGRQHLSGCERAQAAGLPGAWAALRSVSGSSATAWLLSHG